MVALVYADGIATMPASASATTIIAHQQAASRTISRGCGALARRQMPHVRWCGLTASSGCPRIGIGATHHRGKKILAITETASVTVIELRTGEVLSTHDIDPDRAY